MKENTRNMFMELESELNDLHDDLEYKYYPITKKLLTMLCNNLLVVYNIAKEEGSKNGDIDV